MGEAAAAEKAVRRGGSAASHDERRISPREVNLGSYEGWEMTISRPID